MSWRSCERNSRRRHGCTEGLTGFADSLLRELSGGMRQRVARARALAPEPDVLLLYEPCWALDAHTHRAMQDYLLTVWKRTATAAVMVTHDDVLAPRPGHVAEEIDVPVGRRRGPCLQRDERFLDLRDELADLLLTASGADRAILVR